MSHKIRTRKTHALGRQCWRSRLAISLIASLFALGCGGKPDPVGDQPETRVTESKSESKSEFQTAGESTEKWDVLFANNSKIGYVHLTVTPVKKKGVSEKFKRFDMEQFLWMKRFGDTTSPKMRATSVESEAGEVIEFTTIDRTSAKEKTSHGRFDDEQLVIETETLGRTETTAVPWNKNWGGFFAVEQSLLKQPMKPGEKRTVRALQPLMNQVAEMSLEALDYEETPMLSGKQRLLKIATSLELGQVKIRQTVWTDKFGETLKSYQPDFGIVSYRTTKDVALRKANETNFDLGEMSVVKVKRHLQDPHATRRITYLASLPDGELKNVFVTGPSQMVESIDKHSVKITVRSIRPDRPAKLTEPDEPPTVDDLKPNSLIQSDDQRIIQVATTVASDETDTWAIARALERHVHDKITNVNFTQAFATAAEVAASLEGDCTEHAVLLAALCRARKIPARVAIGLVYFPGRDGDGFAYHMWTEAWIKDRWVPLDATLGRGGIGGAHLKLADSNLKGASAYSAFLPVIQVIGRLELEIVSVE